MFAKVKWFKGNILPNIKRHKINWRSFKRAFLMVSLVILPLIIGACNSSSNSADKKSDSSSADQNIILITLDTTYAGHLSCYGYERPTTPNLDQIAKEGLLFKNAYTSVPYTLASHTTLFTSVYPSVHGVVNNNPLKSKLEHVLFPQLLREKGYTTAAFTATNILHNRWSGFAGVFDFYSNATKGDESKKFLAIDAAEQNKRVIEWLENNKDEKFFTWVHYYDAHFPYEAPPPFYDKYALPYIDQTRENIRQTILAKNNANPSARIKTLQLEANQQEKEYLRAKYDEELAFLNQKIGELMQYLKQTGLDKKTTIIIVGDHGESFDHDYIFHGLRLYESSLKVPMIIKSPLIEKPGRTYEGIVELADIFPSIADFTGIPYNNQNPNAKSFFPSFLDPGYNSAKLTFAEIPTIEKPQSAAKYNGPMKSVRAKDLKLIYNLNTGKKELYDLRKDPGEQRNIFDSEREAGTTLFLSLSKWFNSEKQAEFEKVDEKELYETLKSLGYN